MSTVADQSFVPSSKSPDGLQSQNDVSTPEFTPTLPEAPITATDSNYPPLILVLVYFDKEHHDYELRLYEIWKIAFLGKAVFFIFIIFWYGLMLFSL